MTYKCLKIALFKPLTNTKNGTICAKWIPGADPSKFSHLCPTKVYKKGVNLRVSSFAMDSFVTRTPREKRKHPEIQESFQQSMPTPRGSASLEDHSQATASDCRHDLLDQDPPPKKQHIDSKYLVILHCLGIYIENRNSVQLFQSKILASKY